MRLPGKEKRAFVISQFRESGCSVFYETGTYHGEMVQEFLLVAQKIISVELAKHLHASAVRKFKDYSHVTIHHGDSASIIANTIQTINERIFFWLDAHYSRGETALGSKETPIVEELISIGEHSIKNHVILVDDIRCFNGTMQYPTVEELKTEILKINQNYQITIDGDILVAKV